MTDSNDPGRVECPACLHQYEDLWRPALDIVLDEVDEEYLRRASTSTCPECGHTVDHELPPTSP